MVFKASKKRQKKIEIVGIGSPLIPSSAIALKYERELKGLFKAMMADYREKLAALYDRPRVDNFLSEMAVQDASVTSIFNDALKKLKTRWSRVFAGWDGEKFSEEVKKHAHATSMFSMAIEGINAPVKEYNSATSRLLTSIGEGGAAEFNTLVTNIADDVNKRIFTAVMNSLNSPDPDKQGMPGIKKELDKIQEIKDHNIELIVRDQNSKLYSAYTTQTMAANGVDFFIWDHSSAGKVPRDDHKGKDGLIFLVNDPVLFSEPKPADRGMPGFAINCRCRARPLVVVPVGLGRERFGSAAAWKAYNEYFEAA